MDAISYKEQPCLLSRASEFVDMMNDERNDSEDDCRLHYSDELNLENLTQNMLDEINSLRNGSVVLIPEEFWESIELGLHHEDVTIVNSCVRILHETIKRVPSLHEHIDSSFWTSILGILRHGDSAGYAALDLASFLLLISSPPKNERETMFIINCHKQRILDPEIRYLEKSSSMWSYRNFMALFGKEVAHSCFDKETREYFKGLYSDEFGTAPIAVAVPEIIRDLP
jgi:hypothetical protein